MWKQVSANMREFQSKVDSHKKLLKVRLSFLAKARTAAKEWSKMKIKACSKHKLTLRHRKAHSKGKRQRKIKRKAVPKTSNVQMLGSSGKLRRNRLGKARMSLPKDFSIEFSITLKGRVGGWGSVFHFTKSGNCCRHGMRIPAMWFRPNSNKFIVVDGTTRNGNRHTNCGTISYNKRTQIKMRFGRKSGTVWVDGKQGCKLTRHDRKVWKNVKLYVADPWYPAANAVVTKLKMTTF